MTFSHLLFVYLNMFRKIVEKLDFLLSISPKLKVSHVYGIERNDQKDCNNVHLGFIKSIIIIIPFIHFIIMYVHKHKSYRINPP